VQLGYRTPRFWQIRAPFMPRWKNPTPPSFERRFAALRALHPDAHCELDHATRSRLLVPRCLAPRPPTVAVNKVTPKLFAKYPTRRELARAKPEVVQELLSSTGMFSPED